MLNSLDLFLYRRQTIKLNVYRKRDVSGRYVQRDDTILYLDASNIWVDGLCWPLGIDWGRGWCRLSEIIKYPAAINSQIFNLTDNVSCSVGSKSYQNKVI